MPLVCTIDGGYVHSAAQRSRRDGWFQAVCGTVTRHDGGVRRFGFVPNIDTRPRRRIYDTLVSQGLAPNQLVTFLTDGAADLAGWTDLMNPAAEYVLDWFHIAMRFTVLANTLKGVKDQADEDGDVADIAGRLPDEVVSAKHLVWHGNVDRALQRLNDVSCDLDCCAESDAHTKAAKMLGELVVYLTRNRATIPS